MDRQKVAVGVGVGLLALWGLSRPDRSTAPPTAVVLVEQGDMSAKGGTPTVREPFGRESDDPSTTNDESNDQPRGHFGTITLSVCNRQSGNCYPLDGDVSGTELNRLYFPRGGWIDFIGCELDGDLAGECEDEQGRTWEIQGQG